MTSFLKKYNIELKTVGPVFIGSGKETNKKEAIFNNDSVIIVDAKKMFKHLCDKKLIDKYQNYMLDDNIDLKSFFEKNKIRENIYRDWNIKRFDRGQYSRNAKDINIGRFIRDGNEKVYVPGSSLKGMLRTILAGAYIIKNANCGVEKKLDETRRKLGNILSNDILNKEYKAAIDDIEVDIFHRKKIDDTNIADKINDSLRGLMVSDSEYISDEDMCICQKIDISLDGSKNKISSYRECIKPGVSIKFSITVDSRYCDYTKENILAAVKIFYNHYLHKVSNVFVEKWENYLKNNEVINISKKAYTCFLGGGAGFESKTIIYPSFNKERAVDFTSHILSVLFPDIDHNKEVSPSVMKCTCYNKEIYQFGACIFKEDNFKEEPIEF